MIFSMMAKAVGKHDPAIANELQWTWYEQRKPLTVGIGGICMVDYIGEFLVSDLKPDKHPAWKSISFPLGATVLRGGGFPSERETQLHLLGGMKWSHYSHDNGSFTLYGKGDPLVRDWGYKGIMPTWWHSKMDFQGLGYFKDFAALDSIDVICFEYKRQITWLRSIMMIKDKDPLGPNYYLLNDWVKGKAKTDKWQLWLYTKKVPMIHGNVLTATGRGDVDLDIYFAPPWADKIERIDASEASFINDPNKIPEAKEGLGGGDNEDEDDDDFDFEEKKSPYAATQGHSYQNAGGGVSKGTAPFAYRYSNRGTAIFQRALTLVVPRGKTIFTVLYPRLRTQKPAAFTPLGSQGVKIVSAMRTDYAFLGSKAFSYQGKDIKFHGKSGAVIIEKNRVTLSIGSAGSIIYKKMTLKADKPAEKTFPVSP